MSRFACMFFFFLIVSWNAGCTPQNPKAPPVGKVSGTVKLDGNPMSAGEVRFTLSGQPAKICEIKDGAFSGEAYAGKNQIDVVWDKDMPNPSNPAMGTMKVNAVSVKFSGPNSSLNAEVTAGAAKEFNFEVTSAARK